MFLFVIALPDVLFLQTALHWGAKLGRKDLVRLIADTGIDINYKTHVSISLSVYSIMMNCVYKFGDVCSLTREFFK